MSGLYPVTLQEYFSPVMSLSNSLMRMTEALWTITLHVERGARPYFLWVDYLLSQEGVLSGAAVEQAPVHLQVPDERVAGAGHQAADHHVEEHSVLRFVWGKAVVIDQWPWVEPLVSIAPTQLPELHPMGLTK